MYNYTPGSYIIAIYCPDDVNFTADYNFGSLALRFSNTCLGFASSDNGLTWTNPTGTNGYTRENQTPTSDLSDFIRANRDVKATYTENWSGAWGFDSVTANDVLLSGIGTALAHPKWPLTGTKASRTILANFGVTWSYEECPSGISKKHAGLDIGATANETVYAAAAGVVKAAQTDATWGGWVTIEHPGPFTTVYWHITPSVYVNDNVVKGQAIGTVVNYGGPVHLHFGWRNSSHSNTSNRGALPVSSCSPDPAHPENFIDTNALSYE